MHVFQVPDERKSSPTILEGQEGEVHDRDGLDQMAAESKQEAGRAMQELKESSSILLQKVGEAIGFSAAACPAAKENALPQTPYDARDGNPEASSGLNIDKARHHGDLREGKILTQTPPK